MPRLEAIVIHFQDPGDLARFYAEVLGLPVNPGDDAAIAAGTLGEDESVLLGSRDTLHVWLTLVRDLEPAPGHIHLDAASDLGRLIVPGATRQWDDPKGRGPCWPARRETSSAPYTRTAGNAAPQERRPLAPGPVTPPP